MDKAESESKLVHKRNPIAWLNAHLGLFVVILATILLALIPLYGILFPPLVDFSQHILVGKLLYEELTGTSNLDLELSWYLGYRLTSYLIALNIGILNVLGISLVYLPNIIAILLVSLHALIVVPILNFGRRSKDWKSAGLTICFALPAVVCIYSACWYYGFIGYTLSVSFLVAAVFFTEKWMANGQIRDAIFLFASLVLLYTAHPFPLVFWLLWCLCRTIVSIPMWTIGREWRRLFALGAVLLPILAYHFFATHDSGAPSLTKVLGTVSPFVDADYWYKYRFIGFLQGTYLKADTPAAGAAFSWLTILLIVSSIVFAFWSRQNRTVKTAAFATPLFLIVGSLINESFFPIPQGYWLAYDWRFNSAAYTLCLAVAAAVLIRSLPVGHAGLAYIGGLIVIALTSLIISTSHIYEVSQAYARFDPPARAFMQKVLDRERPTGISLDTGSLWYKDLQMLRHYNCLQDPDCNPAGTGLRNFGGVAYPISVKSPKRIFPSKPYPPTRTGKPGNALTGGEGYWGGQFSQPHGIASDKAGNLYVADTGNSRVQKFDAEGNFIDDFGTYGDKEGEFKSPYGVAVDADGSIYVSDPLNNKLMRFSQEGRFIKEWKGPATSMSYPGDISIAPNKNLYIVDLDKIVRFDPAADKFSTWGTSGKDSGQFLRLSGIDAGSKHVAVADSGNSRIQVFDLDGKFIRQWEVAAWGGYYWHYPDVVYDDTLDRYYVTSGWSREVLVFDSGGRLIEKFTPTVNIELNNPSSVALSAGDKRKRLYVVSTGSDIIVHGEPCVTMFELTE